MNENKSFESLIKEAKTNLTENKQIIGEEANDFLNKQKEEKKKEYLKYFSQNLKRYREKKNLSKNQLGNMCGLLPPNYHRYEAGIQEPGAITALKIAAILGITVQELFAPPQDPRINGYECQGWFESLGFKTYFDDENTISIVIDGIPTQTVTVEEAKEIIESTKTLMSPIIQEVAALETIKRNYKNQPKTRVAAILQKQNKKE